jgi:hypothetical protein
VFKTQIRQESITGARERAAPVFMPAVIIMSSRRGKYSPRLKKPFDGTLGYTCDGDAGHKCQAPITELPGQRLETTKGNVEDQAGTGNEKEREETDKTLSPGEILPHA